jgi:hypothetical protein
MDDQVVLGHLLQIESEAAALVNDSQAEADRRTAEGEEQNRAVFEKRYGDESAGLEAEYQKEITKVKDQYQKELETYREKLNTRNSDTGRFSALMEELLSGDL